MQTIDFSNCKLNNATNYGGSDRKFGIFYQGEPYMIKFAEKGVRKNDLATSNINNCISEYIGSHIAISIGIPTHDTLLGYYKDELVVACKDFCKSNQVSQEFANYMRMTYDSCDIGKLPRLEQIYDVINSAPPLQNIKQDAITRYWDTFIIDALLANFDRHKGNWGYLADKDSGEITLAPTYDYGSTLYPALSDFKTDEILENPKEICERIFVFPNAALTVNGVKVSYYDMLTSGYNQDCLEAIKRIVPRIDMNKIHTIIDETPIISDERKQFYKVMIDMRKELLLDVAYECAVTQNYDKKAYQKIAEGVPYTTNDFEADWNNHQYDKQKEYILSYIGSNQK